MRPRLGPPAKAKPSQAQGDQPPTAPEIQRRLPARGTPDGSHSSRLQSGKTAASHEARACTLSTGSRQELPDPRTLPRARYR